MAIGVRAEGKKVNSNINVTPMVDVMLVLLIIFMVITPMVSNKANVDLPKVSAATIMENASKEDAINVAVTRDGKVFFGGDVVDINALGQRVTDALSKKTAADADRTVYFRADTRANYGRVMDVIDAVRTSGTSQLAILTETNNDNQ